MSAPKPAPPSAAPQVEETIQIALAAAGTATDAAQEIQRLKKQVNTLIEGSRKTGKLLLYAGILVTVIASGALAAGIILYNHSLTRFENLSKVNKDALTVFADEINGLTQTAKRIEESAAMTAQNMAVLRTRTDELKKSVDGFAAVEKNLIAKIEGLEASGAKIPAGVKQVVDELVAANRTAVAQLVAAVNDPAKAAAMNTIISRLDGLAQMQRTQAVRSEPERPRTPPPAAAPARPAQPAPMVRYP